MKINQYCSVCKKHLDMDLVPTDDGGDDGVIWLRCPECRGFLPKFSAENYSAENRPPSPAGATDRDGAPEDSTDQNDAPDLNDATGADEADLDLIDEADETEDEAEPAASAATAPAGEPIAEYAAALAAADVDHARSYRSSGDFAVGEVIFHLAWDDCGLVIAKETLPGNRRAIKVYFATVGVVHLIEQSQDVY